jgi:ribosome-associated protein
MPTPREVTRQLLKTAIAASEDKKASDIAILELDEADSGLTDYFLIASAANERQAVAIADEIELRLKREHGLLAHSVEGRRLGEWILLDYVDFVVHIFLTERRAFYDIERLRKSARKLRPEALLQAGGRSGAKERPAKKAARKTAAKSAKSAGRAAKSTKQAAAKKAAKKSSAEKAAKPARPAKSVKKPAGRAGVQTAAKVKSAKKAVKKSAASPAKKSERNAVKAVSRTSKTAAAKKAKKSAGAAARSRR